MHKLLPSEGRKSSSQLHTTEGLGCIFKGKHPRKRIQELNSSPPHESEWKENETQFSMGQLKLNLHFSDKTTI